MRELLIPVTVVAASMTLLIGAAHAPSTRGIHLCAKATCSCDHAGSTASPMPAALRCCCAPNNGKSLEPVCECQATRPADQAGHRESNQVLLSSRFAETELVRMTKLDLMLANASGRLRFSHDGRWTIGHGLALQDGEWEASDTGRSSTTQMLQEPATDLNVLAIGIDCDDIASLLGWFIRNRVSETFPAEFGDLVKVGLQLLRFEVVRAGEKTVEIHAVVHIECLDVHWLIEPQLDRLKGPLNSVDPVAAQDLLKDFEPKGARRTSNTVWVATATLDLDTRAGSEPDIWWGSKTMFLRVARYIGTQWTEFVNPARVDDLSELAPKRMQLPWSTVSTDAMPSQWHMHRSSADSPRSRDKHAVPQPKTRRPKTLTSKIREGIAPHSNDPNGQPGQETESKAPSTAR